ncbi:Uncharacterised protein [uncultured archaeon]|nr:Uncharacterised protein [uncultured archaeon]
MVYGMWPSAWVSSQGKSFESVTMAVRDVSVRVRWPKASKGAEDGEDHP